MGKLERRLAGWLNDVWYWAACRAAGAEVLLSGDFGPVTWWERLDCYARLLSGSVVLWLVRPFLGWAYANDRG